MADNSLDDPPRQPADTIATHPEPQWTRVGPYVLITLVVFATHGLLLLNDGVYFDDWIWLDPATGVLDRARISSVFTQAGMLPTGEIPIRLFSLFGHRGPELVAIIVSALCVYALAGRLRRWTPIERLLLVTVFVTYPAYQTWVLQVTAHNVYYYTVFLVGALVLATANDQAAGRRWLARAAAWLLFGLSFNLNSLLVFYFGLLAVLFFTRPTGGTARTTRVQFASERLADAILPLVFWAAKQHFAPRQGAYADYNQFSMTAGVLAHNARAFADSSLWQPFVHAVRACASHPLLLLLAAAVGTGVGLVSRQRTSVVGKSGAAPGAGEAAGGALLLFLAMVPYLAVGLAPTFGGVASRHAILISLPVAILLVSIARRLSPTWGLRYVAYGVIGALCIGFWAETTRAYIDWQNRWIKDRSMIAQLSASDDARQYSVFVVDDHLKVPDHHDYRDYEYVGIFRAAWGGSNHIGTLYDADPSIGARHTLKTDGVFGALAHLSPSAKDDLRIHDLDPAGCQAILTVTPGREWQTGWRLTREYYAARARGAEAVARFLGDVSRVQLTPIDAPPPVRNPRLGCRAAVPDNMALLRIDQPISAPGQVVSVDLTAAYADSLRVQVWTRLIGALVMTGESSSLAAEAGNNQLRIDPPLRVAPGDLIGVYSSAGSIRASPVVAGEVATREGVILDGMATCLTTEPSARPPFPMGFRIVLEPPDRLGLGQSEAPMPSYEGRAIAPMTFLDLARPIPEDVRLRSWIVNVVTREEVRLKIWRREGDAWFVVASSPVERPTLGFNRFGLTPAIAARAGDYVGFYTNWHDYATPHPFPIAPGGCGNGGAGSRYVTGDFSGRLRDGDLVADKKNFQIYVSSER